MKKLIKSVKLSLLKLVSFDSNTLFELQTFHFLFLFAIVITRYTAFSRYDLALVLNIIFYLFVSCYLSTWKILNSNQLTLLLWNKRRKSLNAIERIKRATFRVSNSKIRKFENLWFHYHNLQVFLFVIVFVSCFSAKREKEKKTFFRFYIKGLCLMPRLLKKTEQNLPL